MYKNWEPINAGQLLEATSVADYPLGVDDVIVGCVVGHPAEVILILTEEIVKLTTLVTDCKLSFLFYCTRN